MSIIRIFHTLFPRLCRHKLMWRGNTLLCSCCNRVAGFRYRIGADDLRIYLFPDFDDMREEIMNMESTRCVFTREDVLGVIDFADFDNAIEEMRAIAVSNEGDLIDDCDPTWYELCMDDEPDTALEDNACL